jgi:hypothetical protein
MDGENNGLIIVIVFFFILIVIMAFRNSWTITDENGKKCINNYGLCNDGYTCKNDTWGSNCPYTNTPSSSSSSSTQPMHPYYIIPADSYNPNQPIPPPAPVPYQPVVGGCAGTQFGCCPNSSIAKRDSNGSNCGGSSSMTGCQHTVYGCCPDSSGYAKIDSAGSNCHL